MYQISVINFSSAKKDNDTKDISASYMHVLYHILLCSNICDVIHVNALFLCMTFGDI